MEVCYKFVTVYVNMMKWLYEQKDEIEEMENTDKNEIEI